MFEDVGSIAASKRRCEPQISEPGKIFLQDARFIFVISFLHDLGQSGHFL